MIPSQSQVTLLEEVANGKRVFGPDDDSDEARGRFQIKAEEIVELGEEGLLDGCNPMRESRTGRGDYVRVMVKGLTAEGRRTLGMYRGVPHRMSFEEYKGKLEEDVKHWKGAVDEMLAVLQDARLSEGERVEKASALAQNAKTRPEW